MNVLHNIVQTFLPYAISVFEIIGILVVCFAGIKGFWQYCQNTLMRKKVDFQVDFAMGLAVGLEFKMAAEILKTVLLQSLDEIYMLGAVILLRALLSLLIHFELSSHKKNENKPEETAKDEQNVNKN